MARFIPSLFLLILGATNLFLTLWAHIQIQQLDVLMVDPTRKVVQWATPEDRTVAEDVDLALKDALRIEFGWGRFHDQETRVFHTAYWDVLRIEDGCQRLYNLDPEIERIHWGGNYALIHFKDISEILQVNLHGSRKGPAVPENPTGWRFDAWLCLVEAEGVGL